MDAIGIDAALAASQKGLMLPAGLAFLALSAKGLAAAERCRHPRRYWDLAVPARRASPTCGGTARRRCR